MEGATCSICALVVAGIAAVPVAFPFPASAADSLAVVAVAPPPGPSPALLGLTEVLRRRIAEQRPGTVDPSRLMERSAVAPGEALPALERAFDQARLDYLEGDAQRSLRILREVAEALERYPGSAEARGLWTRTMLRIARTELDLGRGDAVRSSLERLLRGVPDLSVDPLQVSARLVAEIERARAAQRALPVGTLVVTSSAPGAQVFVNGRALGPAPVRLALPAGPCRVAGATETSQIGPLELEVGEAGKEVLLDFAVLESLRAWAGQGLWASAEERPRRLVAAGALLGVDRIVGVALDGPDHLLASVWDVRRGLMEREGRLRLVDGTFPARGDSALAHFIVSGRTDNPLVLVPGLAAREPSAGAPFAPPSPAASPAASPAWRWTPVATAAASVGFTALAVLQVRDAQDAYDRATRFRAQNGLATFRNIGTYNGYVAEGDTARRRAVLYWTGAGLGAAATAIIGYLSYRRTGELGPWRF